MARDTAIIPELRAINRHEKFGSGVGLDNRKANGIGGVSHVLKSHREFVKEPPQRLCRKFITLLAENGAWHRIWGVWVGVLPIFPRFGARHRFAHSPDGAYRLAAALHAVTTAHNQEVTDPVAEHRFRTGIATGDAAWDAGKPIGNVVNVCSRHQAACAGDDLIIDEATFASLAENIRLLFGPQETIRDKHGAGYSVRRTAFGAPL